MVFTFHSDIVSVTEQGESLPEIKAIRKKENCNDILEYVYWNYDRDSIFFPMLIQDRLKVVHSDKFAHLSAAGYKALAKDSAALVKKLELLQFTPNELLIEGMNKKIGEYLEYWNRNKIKDDNHKHIADSISNAEALLKMKERLMNIVSKEKAIKRMGGGAGTLIETMSE
jgi:hypothetical protein